MQQCINHYLGLIHLAYTGNKLDMYNQTCNSIGKHPKCTFFSRVLKF